jgi:RNA polymerase sigma-70 factor (ECF subfamily)
VDCSEQSSHWCQALYEEKAPGIILYGRALGLSHGEAEDLLQETFVALLRLERPPEEPVGYCLRCFRNRVLNYKRSLWRRLTRELESAAWFEKSDDTTQAEKEAMRCLESLPPEQREVIVLKIWNEFTFEAIAGLLGISPNTAAGRYRYGLNRLRTLLTPSAYERDRSLGKAVAVLDAASALPQD